VGERLLSAGSSPKLTRIDFWEQCARIPQMFERDQKNSVSVNEKAPEKFQQLVEVGTNLLLPILEKELEVISKWERGKIKRTPENLTDYQVGAIKWELVWGKIGEIFTSTTQGYSLALELELNQNINIYAGGNLIQTEKLINLKDQNWNEKVGFQIKDVIKNGTCRFYQKGRVVLFGA